MTAQPRRPSLRPRLSMDDLRYLCAALTAYQRNDCGGVGKDYYLDRLLERMLGEYDSLASVVAEKKVA